MPEHSLQPGIRVIEALTALGSALGYTVRTELPVEQRANAPAVDVAWFSDDEQLYPLMIFEIESAATNAMANNPTKVYGQAPEKFERPLFFFHIVVRSGQQTTRVDNLRFLFGQHNYRVYELDRGMGQQVLCDVLSQHRRLHRTLELGQCLSTVARHAVFDVSPELIVDHVRQVNLRAHYLSDLAALAAADPKYHSSLLRAVEIDFGEDAQMRLDLGYRSYFGITWCTPIHVAMLVHAKRISGEEGLNRLRWWQERSSYMTQIGPHFGLSRDYDLFVLGMAGGLWTLLASLMADHAPALEYIAEQMSAPLAELAAAENDGSFYTGLWTLHVSAFCAAEKHYEMARRFLNERGGVAKSLLYSPPAMLNLDDDCNWLSEAGLPAVLAPSREEFRRELSRRAEQVDRTDPLVVACELLAPEGGTHERQMQTYRSHLATYLALTLSMPV